jgi:hypothetical protein
MEGGMGEMESARLGWGVIYVLLFKLERVISQKESSKIFASLSSSLSLSLSHIISLTGT